MKQIIGHECMHTTHATASHLSLSVLEPRATAHKSGSHVQPRTKHPAHSPPDSPPSTVHRPWEPCHTHTGLLAVVAAVRRRVVVVLVAQGGHGALRLWRERWTQPLSPTDDEESFMIEEILETDGRGPLCLING